MAKSFNLESLVNTGDQEKAPDKGMTEGQGASKPAPKPRAPAKKAEAAPAPVPSKRLSLTLDGETYRKLRMHAVETDRTHQDILADAVDAYLRKHAVT